MLLKTFKIKRVKVRSYDSLKNYLTEIKSGAIISIAKLVCNNKI